METIIKYLQKNECTENTPINISGDWLQCKPRSALNRNFLEGLLKTTTNEIIIATAYEFGEENTHGVSGDELMLSIEFKIKEKETENV